MLRLVTTVETGTRSSTADPRPPSDGSAELARPTEISRTKTRTAHAQVFTLSLGMTNASFDTGKARSVARSGSVPVENASSHECLDCGSMSGCR